MSLFIATENFVPEVERQLMIVALPNPTAGQQPMILPPKLVPGGRLRHWWSKTDIKYSQVMFHNATSLTDLGAQLVAKLANNPAKHVFIHGVDTTAIIIIKGGTATEERHTVGDLGGGFTTEVDVYPHVEVFVDGSTENTNYGIWTTDYGGWGSDKGLPYVRLYHELVHADRIITGLTHGEKTMVPLVNKFRKQRGLGYERATPWFGEH